MNILKKSLIALLIIVVMLTGAWFAPYTGPAMKRTAYKIGAKFMSKDTLIYNNISAFIPMYQTEVGIERLTIKKGYEKVEGFFVAAPEGFKNPDLLQINEIVVDFDLSSLLTDQIVINEITIDGIHLFLEDSSAGTNAEVMLEKIFDFIDASIPEIQSIVEEASNAPKEEQQKAQANALKKIQSLLAGEDLTGSKLQKLYKKAAIVMFGGNSNLIDRFMNLQSEDMSDEDYKKEMEYWSKKEYLIKKIEIKNCQIRTNDKKIKFPTFLITNLDSKTIEVPSEENLKSRDKFNEGMEKIQKDLVSLTPLFERIGLKFQEKISEIMFSIMMGGQPVTPEMKQQIIYGDQGEMTVQPTQNVVYDEDEDDFFELDEEFNSEQ